MTSQIVYPPPPPTTNVIPSKHRLRLMRSTRKLGAVLGTVAQLSETDPKKFQELLPIGVQCSPRPSTSSSSSSNSSVKSSRRQGSIFTSPPMTPDGIYSSASSMSSMSSLALSDATSESLSSEGSVKSTFKLTSNRKLRRNELPLPLVLSWTAVPTRFQSSSGPACSYTLTPPTPSALEPPSPFTPVPTTPVSPTPSETRRKRMAKLTRTLGEKIPPQLVTFATKKLSTHSLKSTLDINETFSTRPSCAGRRRSMSVDFGAGCDENLSTCGRSSSVWVTEHPSWTGEWNRRDIRDVQNQLRSLKAC